MLYTIPSMTPELKFAALLSRPKLCETQIAAGRSLIHAVDLSKFKRLVSHHRIWPCVYRNINDYFPDLLTEPALSFLKEKYQRNLRQTQRTFETCGKLLRRFKELQVDVKVLKGMPLAFKLYGDISKRHSNDLDLIIPDTELNQAHAILTSFGFQCTEFEALTKAQKSIYFEAHKDIAYYDEAGTFIELHVRLSAFPTKLSNHYVQSFFNNPSISQHQEAELIYLCLHGSHTLFHRLKWLVDIALYIEQEFSDNSKQLIKLSSQLEAMRILTVSWVLANILFGTKIPNEISSFRRRDLAARIIISKCLKQLNNPKPIKSLRFKLERFFCEFLLYQNNSEKIAAISHKLKPSTLDFRSPLTIPSNLSFLYYLLRPFLFLYRRWLTK